MKTTIFIFTYNKLQHLIYCINNVWEFYKNLDYEIIVAYNKSKNEVSNWIENQSYIKLIPNIENASFQESFNKAIKMFGGDNIVVLNDNILLSKNSIENLLSALYSDDKVGAVGPIFNYCDDYGYYYQPYNSFDEYIKFTNDYNFSDSLKWEERLKLSNLYIVLKREVIEAVGEMDENFNSVDFFGSDYLLRVIEKGYKLILCKDTLIHNLTNKLSNIERSDNFSLYINEGKFLKKWAFSDAITLNPSEGFYKLINNNIKEMNILELNCGCGANLLYIKNFIKDCNLYGVEKNEAALNLAKLQVKVLKEKEFESFQEHFHYILFTVYNDNILDIIYKYISLLKEDGELLIKICSKNFSNYIRYLNEDYLNNSLRNNITNIVENKTIDIDIYSYDSYSADNKLTEVERKDFLKYYEENSDKDYYIKIKKCEHIYPKISIIIPCVKGDDYDLKIKLALSEDYYNKQIILWDKENLIDALNRYIYKYREIKYYKDNEKESEEENLVNISSLCDGSYFYLMETFKAYDKKFLLSKINYMLKDENLLLLVGNSDEYTIYKDENFFSSNFIKEYITALFRGNSIKLNKEFFHRALLEHINFHLKNYNFIKDIEVYSKILAKEKAVALSSNYDVERDKFSTREAIEVALEIYQLLDKLNRERAFTRDIYKNLLKICVFESTLILEKIDEHIEENLLNKFYRYFNYGCKLIYNTLSETEKSLLNMYRNKTKIKKEKKVCFFVVTVYHLVTSIILCKTIYRDYNKILVISDSHKSLAITYDKVKDAKIFNDIIYLKENQDYERYSFNDVNRMTSDIEIFHFFTWCSYMSMRIFDFIDRDTKIILTDEGLATYSIKEGLEVWIENYGQNKGAPFDLYRIDEILLYNKDIYIGEFKNPPISEIDTHCLKDKILFEELINDINYIFNYKEEEDNNVIFFDQYLSLVNVLSVKEEREILKAISELSEIYPIVVKKHTLERLNKYSDLKLKLYKYGDIPWEVVALNSLNKGKKVKTYISYVSTCMLTDFMLLKNFDTNNNYIFLYKILEKYTNIFKNTTFEKLLTTIEEKYNVRFYVPEDFKELKEIFESLTRESI